MVMHAPSIAKPPKKVCQLSDNSFRNFEQIYFVRKYNIEKLAEQQPVHE